MDSGTDKADRSTKFDHYLTVNCAEIRRLIFIFGTCFDTARAGININQNLFHLCVIPPEKKSHERRH